MEAWLIAFAAQLSVGSGDDPAAAPIGEQWFRIVLRAAKFGGWARQLYEASPLRAWYAPTRREYAELLVRAAIRLDVSPKVAVMEAGRRDVDRRDINPPAEAIASAMPDVWSGTRSRASATPTTSRSRG